MDDKKLEKRFIFFTKISAFISQLILILLISLLFFQIFTNSKYLSSISFPLIAMGVFATLFLQLIRRIYMVRFAFQKRIKFLIFSSILVFLLMITCLIILIWPFIRNSNP